MKSSEICPNSPQELIIETGTIEIGSNMYTDCPNWTSVVLPNSVIKIHDKSFVNLGKLTSFDCGEGLESIGSQSLSSLPSITKFILGKNVKSIGSWSLSFDPDLVENHSPFFKYEGGYFYDVNKHVIISVNDKIKSCNPDGTIKIVVPDAIYSLRSERLRQYACDEFYVHKNLTTIAALDMPKSKKYFVDQNNLDWKNNSDNTMILDKDDRVLTARGWTGAEINVVNNVPAFTYHSYSLAETSIQRATFDSSTTALPFGLFMFCYSLKSVRAPNITKLPGRLVRGCSSLETIEFSPQLTALEFECFRDCVALKPLTIPATVNIIELDALFQVRDVITVDKDNKNYIQGNLNEIYTIDYTNLTWTPARIILDVRLNENCQVITVRSINGADCKKIFLPKNLAKIENDGISSCPFLKTIVFLGESATVTIDSASTKNPKLRLLILPCTVENDSKFLVAPDLRIKHWGCNATQIFTHKKRTRKTQLAYVVMMIFK